eukprot:5521707-Pleurochrysis_carterae.AAC.2
MEIRADVGEHDLDTVMIAELDVNAVMNATPSQVDTPVALIKRMKHAFEVLQLLHDPGLPSAMRTVQLNSNVVVKKEFLRLRLWCSEKEQMRKSHELCRYRTEIYLSKYVLSTRVNSGESFFGSAEAHEVTEVFIKLIADIERYLEPASTASVPGSDCNSNTTLSDDNVVFAAEFIEPESESARAEPMAAVGTPASLQHSVEAHAIARPEKSQEDMQRLMKATVSHAAYEHS